MAFPSFLTDASLGEEHTTNAREVLDYGRRRQRARDVEAGIIRSDLPLEARKPVGRDEGRARLGSFGCTQIVEQLIVGDATGQ